MTENKSTLQLAAVGDLLLMAGPDGAGRDAAAALAPLADAWRDCDVVLGNLECTLPGDGRTVPTEPRVVGSDAMVRAVAAAGVSVVTLANNHMFDCLDGGFGRLTALLDELGVAWFGAGLDYAQAARPALVRAGGRSIAFVGGADRRSGTPFFATNDQYGVRPLDDPGLCEHIRALAGEHDHVIVCPHWGEERFDIPSPEQVDWARAWIDAGATAVVGHHPHVLQGVGTHAGRPIAYSLGNCLASPVHFSDGDVMNWNRAERTGCLLRLGLSSDAAPTIDARATFDDGTTVTIDTTSFGRRRIARTTALLNRPITLKRYRREFFRVKTLIPILQHLRPSQLVQLRPRHIRNALRLLRRGRAAK